MTGVYGTSAATYGMQDHKTDTAKANNVLGKDDFLKLLIAQLTNQDPMTTMDQNDMMAQIVQLSLIEQIGNMSDSINGLKETMNGLYNQSLFTQGVALMGKEVKGMNEEGKMLTGQVTGVKWNERDLMLKIGENWLNINGILEIKEEK